MSNYIPRLDLLQMPLCCYSKYQCIVFFSYDDIECNKIYRTKRNKKQFKII